MFASELIKIKLSDNLIREELYPSFPLQSLLIKFTFQQTLLFSPSSTAFSFILLFNSFNIYFSFSRSLRCRLWTSHWAWYWLRRWRRRKTRQKIIDSNLFQNDIFHLFLYTLFNTFSFDSFFLYDIHILYFLLNIRKLSMQLNVL